MTTEYKFHPDLYDSEEWRALPLDVREHAHTYWVERRYFRDLPPEAQQERRLLATRAAHNLCRGLAVFKFSPCRAYRLARIEDCWGIACGREICGRGSLIEEPWRWEDK